MVVISFDDTKQKYDVFVEYNDTGSKESDEDLCYPVALKAIQRVLPSMKFHVFYSDNIAAPVRTDIGSIYVILNN